VKSQPVLIFAYNRIDTLEKIIDSLPLDADRKVLISIDGPRLDGATKNSFLVRELCEQFRSKFPTQVQVIDREINLGLQDHCVMAMKEFFSRFESGIVLDDDIIPSISFYQYMDYFLNTFDGKGDIKIVNGWTPLFPNETRNRFHTTKYFVSWGWGTWATFFNQVDFGLINYDTDAEWWRQGTLRGAAKSLGFRRYWTRRFEKISSSSANRSWDWELLFELWRLGGKALSPAERLTTNLGYDEFAFHPNSGSKRQKALARHLELKNLSNVEVICSRQIEKFYERKMWDLSYQRMLSMLQFRIGVGLQAFRKSR
jgi:hypothetical protein